MDLFAYLMVNLFVECLDGISELVSFKIIVQEYILELIDHPIKDGNCDLNIEGNNSCNDFHHDQLKIFSCLKAIFSSFPYLPVLVRYLS